MFVTTTWRLPYLNFILKMLQPLFLYHYDLIVSINHFHTSPLMLTPWLEPSSRPINLTIPYSLILRLFLIKSNLGIFPSFFYIFISILFLRLHKDFGFPFAAIPANYALVSPRRKYIFNYSGLTIFFSPIYLSYVRQKRKKNFQT